MTEKAPTGYISIEEHDSLVDLVRKQAFGAGMAHWADLTKESSPTDTVLSLTRKLDELLSSMPHNVPPVVFEALALIVKLFG